MKPTWSLNPWLTRSPPEFRRFPHELHHCDIRKAFSQHIPDTTWEEAEDDAETFQKLTWDGVRKWKISHKKLGLSFYILKLSDFPEMELDSILDVFFPYSTWKKKKRHNWNLDNATDWKIGGANSEFSKVIYSIIKIRFIPYLLILSLKSWLGEIVG